MKLLILAMYDKKASMYLPPFATPNYLVAARDLADMINDNQNKREPWQRHPEDFDLYQVSGFETETGTVIPNENGQPIHLSNLAQLGQ